MLKTYYWLEKLRSSSLSGQRHKQNQGKPSVWDQQRRKRSWKVPERNQPSASDRIQTKLSRQSWRFYGQSHCNKFCLQRKTGNQKLNFITIFLRVKWFSKTDVNACKRAFKKRRDRKGSINFSLVNVWIICQNWKDGKNARTQREKGSEGKEKTLRKKKTWKWGFLQPSWVWVPQKNPWSWTRAWKYIWSEREKKTIVWMRKKYQVVINKYIEILLFCCLTLINPREN